MQIVEHSLKLILLYASLFGHKFFQIEQHVRPDLNNSVATRSKRLLGLGLIATARSRINNPVVVLEGMDGLNNSADPSDIHVDIEIVHKLGCQVSVQLCLHFNRAVDPYGRIEEDMVEQLLQQDGAVRIRQLDQEFGQTNYRIEKAHGNMPAGGFLKGIAYCQETFVIN